MKQSASSLGISRHDVPATPIVGEHLQFCGGNFVNDTASNAAVNSTCCTAGMEHKLSTKCRVDYESSLRQSTTQLRRLFTAETQKFDDFFNRLLENGEKVDWGFGRSGSVLTSSRLETLKLIGYST